MPDTIRWHVGAKVTSAVHCNSAALRIALIRVCIALHQRHSSSLTNSPAIHTFAGPTRYPLLPLRLLWLSAALVRHLPFADLTRCSLTPISRRSGALSRLTPRTLSGRTVKPRAAGSHSPQAATARTLIAPITELHAFCHEVPTRIRH